MLMKPRWVSPRTGCSTLITSAPQSARMAPAAGTNVNWATSRTRKPSITLTIPAPPRTRSPDDVEGYWQRGRLPEWVAVGLRIVVGDQGDVRQPVEDALQGDPGLQPGQVQSETRVFARCKCDVGQGLPEDIELLGQFPSAFVTVRRPDAHVNQCVRRNLDTLDLGVFGGGSLHGGQGRLVPKTLFNRPRDQLAVLLHRRELAGVRQQVVEQVPRRPVGRLQTRGQQESQE